MDAGNPPPADAVQRATTEGRKEGLFAGLTSALASGLIGAKFMGLNRNKTIITIVLFFFAVTGGLSGYYFTEAFTQTALKQLQVEWEKRQKEPSHDRPGEERPT
ncbi:uncharacterized protein BT62DRAFT_700828 [Guyanagaster necrorhizus]|uniref:Transmembrane protein n=1 Tax=Guyanagaster necrorhizus TaxID=856835 RepID=A0A9P7VFC4_9AGAR|nr:uncharacterized protein BT62DRAFT_700828 [Guyanagaster necrorhizus MCA 3950]KAG7439542.1 hypothetical protein BT62DRAFT_700828 [Guyanagaster necrorhizus MCA 3950]